MCFSRIKGIEFLKKEFLGDVSHKSNDLSGLVSGDAFGSFFRGLFDQFYYEIHL